MPAQTFDTVPHILFAAHGAMAGGEQWSCGLRTTKFASSDTDAAGLQGVANAVANAWRVVVLDATGYFSVNTTLNGVTARALDSRGITVLQAEGLSSTSTPAPGVQILPNQCSLVVTLNTARAGRTGKGRIYIPAVAATISATTGQIPVGNLDPITTVYQTLVNSINSALAVLTGTPKVGIQSKTAASQLGGGYTGAAVTSVSVGSVVDTQRRRRSSLVETRVVKAIA